MVVKKYSEMYVNRLKNKISKEIKRKKTNLLIHVLYVIAIATLVFSFSLMFRNNVSLTQAIKGQMRDCNTTFIYDGLTDYQINVIENITKLVDPIYFEGQCDIRFVKDIDDEKVCDGVNCSGANINNGEELWVEWNDNIALMKTTYCHELWHTYVQYWDEEVYVRKLGEQHICYVKDNRVTIV